MDLCVNYLYEEILLALDKREGSMTERLDEGRRIFER
jgi:hypothetical protein